MTRNPDILARIVFAGMLVMLVISPTQFSFEVAPKAYVSPIDPLVWVVFAIWAWRALRRDWKRPLRLLPFIGLFLLTCLASVFAAASKPGAIKDTIQFAEYFIAAFFVFSLVHERGSFRRTAIHLFLAVATVIVAWATVEYLRPSISDMHVQGSFGNRNVLGGYLSLVLPLMFALLLYVPDWPRRIWLGVAVVAGCAVTLSGGTAVALVVSMGVIAALTGRRALIAYVLCAAVGVAAVLPHLPRENLEALYRSIWLCSDDGELAARYPEWQAAVVMMLENPWMGVGIGNYQANIGTYYGMIPNLAEAAEADSQNLYLVLASSTGIAGALAFIAMLADAGAKAIRTFACDTKPYHRAVALGALGSIVAFAVNCIWSPLLVRGIGVPLAFILALAFSPGDDSQHAH